MKHSALFFLMLLCLTVSTSAQEAVDSICLTVEYESPTFYCPDVPVAKISVENRSSAFVAMPPMHGELFRDDFLVFTEQGARVEPDIGTKHPSGMPAHPSIVKPRTTRIWYLLFLYLGTRYPRVCGQSYSPPIGRPQGAPNRLGFMYSYLPVGKYYSILTLPVTVYSCDIEPEQVVLRSDTARLEIAQKVLTEPERIYADSLVRWLYKFQTVYNAHWEGQEQKYYKELAEFCLNYPIGKDCHFVRQNFRNMFFTIVAQFGGTSYTEAGLMRLIENCPTSWFTFASLHWCDLVEYRLPCAVWLRDLCNRIGNPELCHEIERQIADRDSDLGFDDETNRLWESHNQHLEKIRD